MRPMPWGERIHLAITIALAVLLVIFVIQGRSAQARRDQGLRTFICYFQHAVLVAPKQTPSGRREAIRFFNGVLAKLHESPCSQP